MRVLCKIAAVLFLIIPTQTLSAEGRPIYGSDLKKIAADYLADRGIFNTILVSEKRAYFPCAEKISMEVEKLMAQNLQTQ